MNIIKRFAALLLMFSFMITICSGCNEGNTDGGEADTVLGSGGSVLRIVSGSENSELEPILEEFCRAGSMCASR